MVKAADIEDRKSLEAWLKDQPREVAIAIAARAAARVIPDWAEICRTDAAKERESTPLPVLRATLVSSVAVMFPADVSIRAAATPAAEAADTTGTAAAGTAATAAYAVAAEADAACFAANAVNFSAASAFAATSATALDHATALEAAATTALEAAAATAFDATAREAKAWHAVQTDAATLEAGKNLTRRPLWPAENPLEDLWNTTREVWSRPGSPYAFWRRWYESLLTGTPMNPDMLYQIALIDDGIWKKGADAVAEEIARIEVEFETGDDDFDKTISALPPASPDRVQATKQAMERHRADLPPTFDAILGFIALEVKRLQERNYRDADDEEEAKRQIRTLTTIYRAVEALQALVPDGPDMLLEDAEKAEKLARLFLNKFKAWPRENAEELVDNTFRLGLAGITAYLLPMIGVSPVAGLAAGMIVFGNKSFADKVKAAKDLLTKSSGG